MRVWSTVAVVLAVLFCRVPTASGQGTTDLFPEPITSADAGTIIDRAGLTGDAKLASLKAFEAYVARFVDLQKGDMDAFVQSRAPMGSSPAREEIVARVDRRRALLRKIAGIENDFFDSVQAAAGEASAPRVTRERARAERRRDWAASNAYLGRGSRVELADIAWEVMASRAVGESALSEETRSAVDATVKSFEHQYTALARKLLDLAVEEPIAMSDAKAAANIAEPPVSDHDVQPTAWRDYFESIEKARRTAREPQLEVRAKIRSNARTSAKTICELLPADVAAEFRQKFLEKSYAVVANPRDPVPGVVKQARAAVETGELTKDELKTIEDLAANHALRRADLVDKMMTAADKGAADSSGLAFRLRLVGDSPDEQSDLEQLAKERRSLDTESMAAISGAAPTLAAAKSSDDKQGGGDIVINGMHLEMPDMIEAGGISGGSASIVVVARDDGGDGGGAVISTFTLDAGSGDRLGTPAPLSRQDVDALREQFKLSTDEAAVLDVLFEDYQAKWHEIEAAELAELRSLPTGGFTSMTVRGTEPTAPSAYDVSRSFELRRAVLDRSLALELEFTEGLSAALSAKITKDGTARVFRARQRAAYLSSSDGGSGFDMLHFGGSGASSQDLAAIVRSAGLPTETLAAMVPKLDDWDRTSVDLLRSRFEARFAEQRVRSEMDRKLAEEAASEGRAGEIVFDSNNQEFAKVNDAAEKARVMDRAVETANKQALAAVLAATRDEAARETLSEVWNRKVWPSVYRDRRDVEPLIAKAMALKDLAPETKAKLETIATEHRAEYRRICHEMIAANEKSIETKEPNSGGPNIDIRAIQARQDATTRLKFERNELNEKTLRRVKESLSPAQAEKIGDLSQAKQAIRFGPGG
ncbi:MAG: hypothetical protein SGJ09_05170 [Phycisphaerae bacterium]|nr:hypothetical protein [Phycisphaerae bacterium]